MNRLHADLLAAFEGHDAGAVRAALDAGLDACTFTLGLLPQMHHWEADVDANVAELLAALGRPPPQLGHVPNRYLA